MLEQILISGLVKILVDIFKQFPKIKSYYLPLIAMATGGILWPLHLWAISGPIIINGLIVGAGAVGLHEAANQIAKSRKEVENNINNQV